MTRPSSPPQLDEAGLRGLAEAVVAAEVALNDAKVFNLTTLSRAHFEACEELDMVIQPIEKTIIALLDALQAEREAKERAERRAGIVHLNSDPTHLHFEGCAVATQTKEPPHDPR